MTDPCNAMQDICEFSRFHFHFLKQSIWGVRRELPLLRTKTANIHHKSASVQNIRTFPPSCFLHKIFLPNSYHKKPYNTIHKILFKKLPISTTRVRPPKTFPPSCFLHKIFHENLFTLSFFYNLELSGNCFYKKELSISTTRARPPKTFPPSCFLHNLFS